MFYLLQIHNPLLSNSRYLNPGATMVLLNRNRHIPQEGPRKTSPGWQQEQGQFQKTFSSS